MHRVKSGLSLAVSKDVVLRLNFRVSPSKLTQLKREYLSTVIRVFRRSTEL